MNNLNSPTRTIYGYTDCMYKIKQLADIYFGRDELSFTSAYPQNNEADNIKTPLVTYKLIKKEPGKFGKQTEIKPRPMRGEPIKVSALNQVSGEVAEITVELEGQTFDYHVLFEIWDEDPERADKRLEQFESFIKQYTGYLKASGLQELIFEEASGLSDNGKWDTTLNCRKIQYLIRIDSVIGAKVKTIQGIHLMLKVYHNQYEYYAVLLDNDYYTVDPPHIPILSIYDTE